MKQPRKKPVMWKERDHGLGINRAVLADEAMALEHSIWKAAKLTTKLGVSFERFCELCEAAMDVAGVEEFEFSDVHADCGIHAGKPLSRKAV